MQVCTNGHVVTNAMRDSPHRTREHCTECGAKTISTCPSCNESIPGKMHFEGVGVFGGLPEAPEYCGSCGEPFPWTSLEEQATIETADRNERREDLLVVLMPMAEDDLSLQDTYTSIREIAEEFGLTHWRADTPATSADIVDEVLEAIDEAEFVIADLSHERPSVYYEAGWAHRGGIGHDNMILIAQDETKVHFDLRNHRIIFYANQTDLKEKLRRRFQEIRGG